jgi:sugar/nucleoside kinase (ribokinase family)
VEAIIEAARGKACKRNPQVHLTITAGKAGSWCWDERRWTHTPSTPVVVAGTAGAGDAHLAGIIAGLATGLPLPLAQQLGSLAAACSITSPDTINKDLDRAALAKLANQQAIPVDQAVMALIV